METSICDQLTNEKMYVKGIVTSNSVFSDQYDNYSYVWLKDQQNENTFELYHCAIDVDDASSYTAENSMVDSEVVAYGYAKKHNSTYELSPLDNNTDYPVILSLRPAGGSEDTPQEQVEALITTSTLAYHYEKEEGVVGINTFNWVDYRLDIQISLIDSVYKSCDIEHIKSIIDRYKSSGKAVVKIDGKVYEKMHINKLEEKLKENNC